jgi:hypothetical protein
MRPDEFLEGGADHRDNRPVSFDIHVDVTVKIGYVEQAFDVVGRDLAFLLQVRHAWRGIGLGRLFVSGISLVFGLAEPIRVNRGSGRGGGVGASTGRGGGVRANTVTLCYLFVMVRICRAGQLCTRLMARYWDIPA